MYCVSGVLYGCLRSSGIELRWALLPGLCVFHVVFPTVTLCWLSLHHHQSIATVGCILLQRL